MSPGDWVKIGPDHPGAKGRKFFAKLIDYNENTGFWAADIYDATGLRKRDARLDPNHLIRCDNPYGREAARNEALDEWNATEARMRARRDAHFRKITNPPRETPPAKAKPVPVADPKTPSVADGYDLDPYTWRSYI